MGNKCDLDHKRQVSLEQGRELARKYNISKFIEVSAKDTVNIEDLFESTASTLIDKQALSSIKNDTRDKNVSGGISLSNQNDNNNNDNNNNDSTCC